MNQIILTIKKIYSGLIILIALIICCGSVGFSIFTVIALGFYASLILVLLFLTRKYLLSVVIASSFIICLQLMNQLKVHYYKERIFFSDFYIACDVKNFSTLFHYTGALVCLVLLILFIVLNGILFRNARKISQTIRSISLVVAISIFTIIVYISQQSQVNRLWQQYLPKGRGTITNLFISANQFYYEPPNYSSSSDYFLTQLNRIEPNIIDNSIKLNSHPDVIVFLQESALNPQLFDIQSNNLPSYDLFNQNNSNLMRVQTFGGGTWLTEFSILTGLNTNDFSYRKNSVYYVVAPHIKTSLFKEFNQNDYYTVVLSPMGFGNYNAGPAYTSFGMQKFFRPQDLGYPAEKNQNLWKIPTQDLLNEVKTLLETYTDKPLFIFVLSMYEHGPYNENYPDILNIKNDISDPKFVGRLNDYLERIQKLNLATLNFNDYIQKRTKPTMFIYFGDHQPALGWDGKYKTNIDNPNFLTQYTLSTNYPINFFDNELTDVSLVGGLIIEKTGIKYSDFYRANIAMRYLCSGKLDDCENKELVESYKHYIYQDLQNAGSK